MQNESIEPSNIPLMAGTQQIYALEQLQPDATKGHDRRRSPARVRVEKEPRPKKHEDSFGEDVDGDELVEWFLALFDGASTYASILAAVMFSSMILDLTEQTPPHGSEREVRIWSAIGAILFVLLVLVCQGASLLLRFHGIVIGKAYDNKKLLYRIGLSFISLLFQALWLAGTVFFCLVVKAYVPAAGKTALGLTGLLALICAIFWSIQLFREVVSQLRTFGCLAKKPQPAHNNESRSDDEES